MGGEVAASTWSSTHPKTQTGSRGTGNLCGAASKEKCTRLREKQRAESGSFGDVGDETLKTDLYDAATSVFSAHFRQSAGISGCECSHCTGSPFMLAVKPNTFRSDFLHPLLGQMFRRHSAKRFQQLLRRHCHRVVL